jgi:hypothetical protein
MTEERTCWCCGQECMFCGGNDPECYGPLPPDGSFVHWCGECKYAGCPACCGCNDCRDNKRAGFTPGDGPRLNHFGLPAARTYSPWEAEMRRAQDFGGTVIPG